MKRAITGFHRDARADWVAELECGHGQHVRHEPPLVERPWTETGEGRRQKLGEALDCVLCDRRQVPSGHAPYRRTPAFTAETTPRALRSQHSTRAGVWARICVLSGALRLRLHAPFHEELHLTPGEVGIALPGVEHEVEPEGEVEFYVEFLRARR